MSSLQVDDETPAPDGVRSSSTKQQQSASTKSLLCPKYVGALLHDRIARSSSRQRVWLPLVGKATGLAACVAGLVGLALLVGHGAVSTAGPLITWLSTVVIKPAVVAPLAFLLLVMTALVLRGLLLEYLARKPGRLEVPDFSAGSSELPATSIAQLSTAFRNELSTLQLRAPAPAPGVGSGDTFVDVLAGGGAKSGAWIETVIALLRATVPRHAYRVDGTLFEGAKGPGRCRVFLQVIRLPNEAIRPAVIEEADWDRAMRHAAAAVMAAILPRTRLCRGPWVAWRGYNMPGDLLFTYEEATRAERTWRYDEALELYYEALAQDPVNLSIRLRIGQLQEKLGLFLDALATYQSMLALEHPGDCELPRRLYCRRVRRERGRQYLIGRYRRAVLLGGGQVADQWLKQGQLGGAKSRDEQREYLRERLMVQVPGLGEANSAEDRETEIRRTLFAEAKEETRQLKELVGKRTRRRGTGLTPRTVAMLPLIEDVYAMVRGHETRGVENEIDRRMKQIGRLSTWAEHYNAACVWAAPLTAPDAKLDDRPRLVKNAIWELERACAHADSGFIAGERDWILSGDPDLSGLRADPRFKIFEARYFASPSLTPQRPRDVHVLASSHYTRDLLLNLAKTREATWHHRATNCGAGNDAHEMIRWWNDEHKAWQAVDDVARNYRDWRSRLKLLKLTRELCADAWPTAEPCFERYEENPISPPAGGNLDDAAALEVRHADQRLDRLPSLLRHRLNGSGAAFHAQREVLRHLDAEGAGIPASVIADLCTHEAAIWERFQEWLVSPVEDNDVERTRELDQFDHEVNAAARRWSRAKRIADIRLLFEHHGLPVKGSGVKTSSAVAGPIPVRAGTSAEPSGDGYTPNQGRATLPAKQCRRS